MSAQLMSEQAYRKHHIADVHGDTELGSKVTATLQLAIMSVYI